MTEEDFNYDNQQEFTVDKYQYVENIKAKKPLFQMQDDEIKKLRDNWFVGKRFVNTYGGKELFEYDPNHLYYGFIDSYQIKRTKTDRNEDYFYISFICSIYVEGFGFYLFNYETPATFTQKKQIYAVNVLFRNKYN